MHTPHRPNFTTRWAIFIPVAPSRCHPSIKTTRHVKEDEVFENGEVWSDDFLSRLSRFHRSEDGHFSIFRFLVLLLFLASFLSPSPPTKTSVFSPSNHTYTHLSLSLPSSFYYRSQSFRSNFFLHFPPFWFVHRQSSSSVFVCSSVVFLQLICFICIVWSDSCGKVGFFL